MMIKGISRRAALRGCVVAGATAALPLAAAGGAWERARAAYVAVVAAFDTFYDEIYTPAEEEIARASGPQPTRLITEVARSGRSATFDVIAGECPTVFWESPARRAKIAAIMEGWNAWEDRRAKAVDRTGWVQKEARLDQLRDAVVAAVEEICATPAPDARALAFKLKVMVDESGIVPDDAHASVVADAYRIAA